MKSIEEKYAELLTQYCLSVKKGDKVYIASTYLAEPLLQQLLKHITMAGGHPVFNIGFEDQEKIKMDHAEKHQLEYINPLTEEAMNNFDCYLAIKSPFNLRSSQNIPGEKRKIVQGARKEMMSTYMQRTGTGDMRRSLCLYPTSASAQNAEMSLDEYKHFVFDACNLYADDPAAEWRKLGKMQQGIVDHLNKCKQVQYKGENIDVSFSVEDRTWINSDGKTNMPSGEVFSAPVEDSVNGWVRFTYPSIYMGKEAKMVELEVKDGEIVSWNAETGKDLLDEVFSIPGARRFGEVAVGTNKKIQRVTKNILFDEKIGGSIHMAVGQAYYQCGGKNSSSVHWDMITDMKKDGQIIADGETIYEKGEFVIS